MVSKSIKPMGIEWTQQPGKRHQDGDGLSSAYSLPLHSHYMIYLQYKQNNLLSQ